MSTVMAGRMVLSRECGDSLSPDEFHRRPTLSQSLGCRMFMDDGLGEESWDQYYRKKGRKRSGLRGKLGCGAVHKASLGWSCSEAGMTFLFPWLRLMGEPSIALHPPVFGYRVLLLWHFPLAEENPIKG